MINSTNIDVVLPLSLTYP